MPASSARASGLAKRYATALFDLANEQNGLDAVAQDLQSLGRMIDDSDDLRRLINSPVVTREDQSKAIGAIGAKSDLGDLTRKFLGILAQQRRLFALPGCITAYLEMLAEHKGEVTAEVTSAQALSDDQLAEVRSNIEKSIGRDVQLDASVDPNLIGGLVVRVGSRMIDASLKTKLQHLEQSMRGLG